MPGLPDSMALQSVDDVPGALNIEWRQEAVVRGLARMLAAECYEQHHDPVGSYLAEETTADSAVTFHEPSPSPPPKAAQPEAAETPKLVASPRRRARNGQAAKKDGRAAAAAKPKAAPDAPERKKSALYLPEAKRQPLLDLALQRHGWDAAKVKLVEQLAEKHIASGHPHHHDPESFMKQQREIYTEQELEDLKRMFYLRAEAAGQIHVKGFRLEFITKACHQCQYQCIYHPCECAAAECHHRNAKRNVPCGMVVCEWCLREHYSECGFSAEELRTVCPVCRGACNCIRHLRDPVPQFRGLAQKQMGPERRKMLQLGLSLIWPCIQQLLQTWKAEMAMDGIQKLSEIPAFERNQERTLCSRCQMTIADVHRFCTGACAQGENTEICLHCCAEMRRRGAGGPIACQVPDCGGELGLRRLVSSPLQTLLEYAPAERDMAAWRRFQGVTHCAGSVPTSQAPLAFSWEQQPDENIPEGSGSHVQPTGCVAAEAAGLSGRERCGGGVQRAGQVTEDPGRSGAGADGGDLGSQVVRVPPTGGCTDAQPTPDTGDALHVAGAGPGGDCKSTANANGVPRVLKEGVQGADAPEVDDAGGQVGPCAGAAPSGGQRLRGCDIEDFTQLHAELARKGERRLRWAPTFEEAEALKAEWPHVVGWHDTAADVPAAAARAGAAAELKDDIKKGAWGASLEAAAADSGESKAQATGAGGEANERAAPKAPGACDGAGSQRTTGSAPDVDAEGNTARTGRNRTVGANGPQEGKHRLEQGPCAAEPALGAAQTAQGAAAPDLLTEGGRADTREIAGGAAADGEADGPSPPPGPSRHKEATEASPAAFWESRLRLVSWCNAPGENHLLCVSGEELSGPDAQPDVQRAFWTVWSQGRPVIVQNCAGKISWEPRCLQRVTGDRYREERDAAGEEKAKDPMDFKLDVINCNTWDARAMGACAFFARYSNPVPEEPLYKLKDYPPSSDFSKVLPRHLQDFLNLLPVPELTRSDCGALNLATMLPRSRVPTDLGPKCYIAMGRPAELRDGDSVTRLHLDMADAINVMLHMPGAPLGQQRTGRTAAPWDLPFYGGAGAVWDIWPRCALPKLRAWLRRNAHLFPDASTASGHVEVAAWEDPVHCQRFMLSDAHRELLLLEEGVQAWHFEQNTGEGVFIPAGCAHQVRNLASSSKVAVDFLSPHSMAICMQMTQENRLFVDPSLSAHAVYNDEELDRQDRLQTETILLHAADVIVSELSGTEPTEPSDAMPSFPAAKMTGTGTRRPTSRPRNGSAKAARVRKSDARSGGGRKRGRGSQQRDATACVDAEEESDEEEEPKVPRRKRSRAKPTPVTAARVPGANPGGEPEAAASHGKKRCRPEGQPCGTLCTSGNGVADGLPDGVCDTGPLHKKLDVEHAEGKQTQPKSPGRDASAPPQGADSVHEE